MIKKSAAESAGYLAPGSWKALHDIWPCIGTMKAVRRNSGTGVPPVRFNLHRGTETHGRDARATNRRFIREGHFRMHTYG